MTIPNGTNFPEALDDDASLFLVHDSLRAQLVEDYNPGDTSITITGKTDVISKFPANGLITLTEQCSEPENRAISFFYGSRTDTTFDELELLPGFPDVVKPKGITNVTQNVMARHHNNLKDALIAIENFIGVEGTIDVRPFGSTLEGRLNFLRKLVLTPRAWFSADRRIGVVPLTVTFTDESFRNPTFFLWDFGDGSGPSSIISASTTVPSTESVVVDTDGGSITKTYGLPDKYDVTLTVSNEFGEDTVTFPEYIIAKAPPPDEAVITIVPTKVRTDTLIALSVDDNGENPLDPVVEYTWSLGDDLVHRNNAETFASYSVGGLYDVKVRVDTELEAYRITTLENEINVVERVNLWWLAFNSPKSNTAITKTVNVFEFGLISETFKTTLMPDLSVTRDHSFTSGYSEETYQRDVFRRNNSFTPRNTTTSGDKGQSLVFWAEDETTIKFRQFEPFDDTWTTPSIGGGGDTLTRNWNWAAINSPTNTNIVFGLDSIADMVTDVNQTRDRIALDTLSAATTTYLSSNYLNGADELTENPDSYPSTYRTTFHLSNGYIARNDAGPGGFFRIRSFYRSEGIIGDLVQNFTKLGDIPGSARTELELVSLSSGVYVFNNSGEVAAYNPSSGTWSTGGPGIGSSAFRALQDITVAGASDPSQPLRAASDGDRRAYLSYDYSPNAFIKFNEADLTFVSLGSRPNSNEQFIMGVY